MNQGAFITVQSPPPKFSYSEELEQGSELYLFALHVFLKKEYRENFP
ncbi:hypothetical protein Pfo_015264 [Paulownia fortunei]|nr:hypothetical protein Pfo_015264 [Paulownia fortunei]